MARYSLAIIPKVESLLKEKIKEDLFFLPFQKENREVYKVDLEDIDLLTTSFSSDSAFRDYIEKKYDLSYFTYDFKIAYTYQNEYRFLDVITNNQFLNTCAQRSKKEKQEGKKDCTLDDSVPDFFSFKKRIMLYIQKKETNLLMQKDYYLIPYPIKKILKPFYLLSTKASLSHSETEDIKEMRETIFKTLSNYKNMRGMLLWEKLYLKGKLKEKETKPLLETNRSSLFYEPKREENDKDPDEYAFFEEEERLSFLGGDEDAEYPYFRK